MKKKVEMTISCLEKEEEGVRQGKMRASQVTVLERGY